MMTTNIITLITLSFLYQKVQITMGINQTSVAQSKDRDVKFWEQDEKKKDCDYYYAIKIFLTSDSLDKLKDKIQSRIQSQKTSKSASANLIKFMQRIIQCTFSNKLMIMYSNSGQKEMAQKAQNKQLSNEMEIYINKLQNKVTELESWKQKFRNQIVRLIDKLAYQSQDMAQIDRRKSQDLQAEFNVLQTKIEKHKQFFIRKTTQKIKHQNDSEVLQLWIGLLKELKARFSKHTKQTFFPEDLIIIDKDQTLEGVKILMGRTKKGIFGYQQYINNFETSSKELTTKLSKLQEQNKILKESKLQSQKKFQVYSKKLKDEAAQQRNKRSLIQKRLDQRKVKDQQTKNKAQMAKLQQQIDSLKRIKTAAQSKEKEINQESSKHSRRFDQMKESINQYNETISKLKIELKKSDDATVAIKDERHRLETINAQMTREIDTLKEEKHRLETINAEKTHKINALQDQKQRLETTNTQLIRDIDSLKKQLNKIKQQLMTVKQQLITATQKVQKQEEDKNRILIQVEQFKTQSQRLQANNERLYSQNSTINEDNKRILRELEQLKIQFKRLQDEINSYIQQKEELQTENFTLKERMSQAQRQISSKNGQLLKALRQQERFTSQLSLLQQKESIFSSRISEIQEIQRRKQQQSQRLIDLELQIQHLKQERCLNFFAYPILQNCLGQKEFIISTLEQRYKSEVLFTRPIYIYDPRNPNNVHIYIDNVSCNLTLGKLTNGMIVAGFSVSPFVSGCSGREAIIMGVSKRQVFYVRANQTRCIIYDDYFIIYGNGELRFKTNNLGVFSNLGINKGYFDSRGHNASTLFDLGSLRDGTLQSYEIYQVVFRVPPPQ